MCHVQGINYEDIEEVYVEGELKDNFIGHALGNATPGNLIERVLPRALQAVGLIEPMDWHDRWADETDTSMLPECASRR